MSDTIERLLGYRVADLVGSHFQDLYAPADREYSEQGFATIRANPAVNPLGFLFLPRTAQVRHADGHLVTVESHATPLVHDPSINAILMEWHLVADRRLLLEAIDAVANSRPLHETQSAIAVLIESLLPGVTVDVLAAQGGKWLPTCPPRHAPLSELGHRLPEPGDPCWLLPWVPLGDRPCCAAWAGPGRQAAGAGLRGADGGLLGLAVFSGPLLDGIALMIGTVHENLLSVALRMLVLALAHDQSHARLQRAAERDQLTGLLNRAGFDQLVRSLASGPPSELGVLFVDLDDFKPVNDTFGHAAGDQLLAAVGRRLEGCLRERDVVARLGGDEFAVLCPDVRSPEVLQALSDRVLVALDAPFTLDQGQTRIGASIGGALGNSTSLPQLLPTADAALYRAKRAGKARFALD